jgi:phospholipid/cholesterol/gamma-HCH transport system substrate-binding protein
MPNTHESPPTVAHIEAKALLLMVTIAALLLGFLLYVMYARGVFESTQRLVLVADDAEGVLVGSDLTFSGFPIGRVQRIELSADGKARLLIDVPKKDARWLRTSSIFTMERGMVGDTRLRAFSGILSDPPLPENAERTVLRGDTTAEIPRIVATTRALLENLQAMTDPNSSINNTLGHLSIVTKRLTGRYGLLTSLLGSEANAQKIITTLDNTNALLARADQLVFGAQGVMSESKATVVKLTGLLSDARASLKKVDAVLAEAQAASANVREATNDLGALRTEVEKSLRKATQLVDEINRKWPFARDSEIKLP